MKLAGKVAHTENALQNCGRALCALGLSLSLAGCASAPGARYLELTYVDFGPQAMAYPLLGQNQLSYRPSAPMGLGLGEVRVIIYRAPATVETAVERFAPDPFNQRDYRYVGAQEALRYLEQRIEQNLLHKVTARLSSTRQRIESWLNS